MSKNKVVERKAFVNSFGSEGPDLKNESFFRIFSAFRVALVQGKPDGGDLATSTGHELLGIRYTLNKGVQVKC